MYFFVHNKKLRETYDTYKVIDNLSKTGFKDPIPEISSTTYIVGKEKRRKR